MKNKLTSRQWKIYKFLKKNCVGKENKMSGREICEALGIEYNSNFKKDIRAIKMCDVITRRIGSDSSGYWMTLKGDDGLNYQKRLAVTYLQTAIKQGVSPEYFHQVLNNIPSEKLYDHQQRITFTPHEHTEVRTNSDDLVGGCK